MTKEQKSISNRNHLIVWKKLKACGAIPNNGKKYVLHHWDESLRHNNIDRYIQWNLYDIEIMEKGEHMKLHASTRSDKARLKMSQAKLGKTYSEEHKRKLSESHKRYWLTHRLTEEEKKRRGKLISEARKRKPLPRRTMSVETRKRMSEAHKGKHHSEETRKKMSESFKGRIISDETCRKLSEAHKNRP